MISMTDMHRRVFEAFKGVDGIEDCGVEDPCLGTCELCMFFMADSDTCMLVDLYDNAVRLGLEGIK